MKKILKISLLSALVAFVGCKSTEEKIAEKLVACDGDACNEIMKELVQLPLDKQLVVKQLMMLDSNYQKKVAKKEAEEKMELVVLQADMYMKLQSAAFEETYKVGAFKWIGFAPTDASGFFVIEGENNSFEADSYVDVGDCPAQTRWIVMPVANGKEISYKCLIESANEKACKDISEKFLSLCK